VEVAAAIREPRRWRFWVNGPLPGLNEIIAAAKGCGGQGLAYSRMKEQWTGTIYFAARAALVPRLARVRLRLDWVHVDKRHDPDNQEAGQKFVWDGLKGPPAQCKAGTSVLANDGWDQNAGTEHHHEVGPRAGVWVTVEEVST
jgi:hypothetical protein